MSPASSLQLMRVVRAASLFTSVLVALLMAANASARDIQLKIDSPRANAKVGNEVSVKTRVRAGRRSHRLSYYVDGKRVVTTRSRSSTNSRRSYGLDTSGLDRGRHRIRVVAEVGGRRASKSVRVFVEPQTSKALAGESVAPVAIPGTELFPTGSAKDFELIFADDFTKPAALGTMGSDSDPNKIVYTGTTGTRWRTYPRTYLDTFQRRPYRSDQVLSVQDGNLDFWLHNVDGQPAGANPSPVLPDGTQYQTYGRYSARIKVDATDLSEYKVAWLLWPKDEQHWASAESDFPEGPLVPGRAGATAYAHYAPGQFETGTDPSVDMHEWHTYTQDWTPLVRRYYVDGRLIHTTVNPVWSGPMRWQLQTETDGYGNNSGHLKVDWVAVYSYAPGTPPSA